jgi:cytochrome c peroxidase
MKTSIEICGEILMYHRLALPLITTLVACNGISQPNNGSQTSTSKLESNPSDVTHSVPESQSFQLTDSEVLNEMDPDFATSGYLENLTEFNSVSGKFGTFSTLGDIDRANPFFKSLGTNGRSCVSCHVPSQGWSITPSSIQNLFERSLTDSDSSNDHPLFRTVDGTVCADADVSTVKARRAAYSLLLNKGLIRVELKIPKNAEFELVNATGTYCNKPERTNVLQLFRRPLPSTNLKFLGAVMWDGRETIEKGNQNVPIDLTQQLFNQAKHATKGHAQALSFKIDDAEMDDIVKFEQSLFLGQTEVKAPDQEISLAKELKLGGPEAMVDFKFFRGINDKNFNPTVFTIFNPWKKPSDDDDSETKNKKSSIYRGQQIFNTKKFTISGVAGHQNTNTGSCGTCHNTPNVGSYSTNEFFDIGVSTPSTSPRDLPRYTVKRKNSNETKVVSDLGRAMITGKWDDIATFKPAGLRGLSAHAPYFHNGMAATLEDVVNFYDNRFRIGLTPKEKEDLVTFLKAL